MNELTGKLKDLYHGKEMHDSEKMKKEAKKMNEEKKKRGMLFYLEKAAKYTLVFLGIRKLIKTLA